LKENDDMEKFLQLLPMFLKYYPIVKEVLDTANSNADIVAGIRKFAAPIVKYLEDWGAKQFPDAEPAIRIAGGAIAAYDPNVTRWLQGACNTIAAAQPPVEVDGIYGPKTTEGVKALQAKLGLAVDGLAGRATQAAVDAWFAKQTAPTKTETT